ncbi:hypothetical protein WDZ92_44315, partial [Nostoc sp. NIES-2111]
MPSADKAAKAAYDRKRRQMLKDKLAAYDKERNALRRADPAYAAAQLERKRAWKAANAERHRRVAREHEQLQRATNPQRRIAKNLRHRLSKAMQGKTKGVSAVRDLGISIEDFRAYIAAMFQPGMTWDNYGQWHLDHIKPLAVVVPGHAGLKHGRDVRAEVFDGNAKVTHSRYA